MRRVVLCLLFLASFPAFARVKMESRKEVVDHFQSAGFSGAAGVFSPSQDYSVAFGKEGSRPISIEDHVLIGSVTTQFTAAAILKLAEQGKLRVTDPVAKYLPAFRYPKITIHHLLSHTSGIVDITGEHDFDSIKLTQFAGIEPLIALILKLPIQFSPGSKWDYSNSNYFLLTKIVEIASGDKWWTFVKRELTDPAGMQNTGFFADRGPFVVSGHDFNKDYALKAISSVAYLERGWASGAGGLESTVHDLARWNSALYGGKILQPSSLAAMTKAQAKVSTGIAYGYGLFISQDAISGETYFFHSGGIPGYIAHNIYYPREGLSSVVLANYTSAHEPADFARALSEIEMHGQTDLGILVDDPMVSNLKKKKYSGSFAAEDSADSLNIRFNGGNLYANMQGEAQQRLVVRGDGWFFNRVTGDELKFNPALPNAVVATIRGEPHVFQRRTAR
jgi:CubicO group peptidase (beta-lactamase class C family)